MTAPRILGGRPDRANFAFDGSIAVSVGDLMFHDTNDVKPASSMTDQLTEAANQLYFAARFAGVANKGRLASDTAADTDFPVLTDIVAEFDCSSDTFEVGDKVTIDEASNGTQLENQKLTKTGDEAKAIGYAVKRYGSATTRVLVRLLSRICVNDAEIPDLAEEPASVTTTTFIFDGATTENEIRVPTNLADALSIEDSAGDLIVFDTTTGTQVITVTPPTVFVDTVSMKDAKNLVFGTGTDAALRWSTGDASDHSLVLALGDTSQMLHITDLAAIATDWNVTSPTHPTLYIHSNTTPSTDYLLIGTHDGTSALIDVVGGSDLKLKLGGTEYASVRVTGLAVGTYVVASGTAGTDQLTLKSTGTAPAGTGANVGHLFADFETDDDELFWLSGTNGTSTQLTT